MHILNTGCVRSVADLVIETGVPQHRVRKALRILKEEGAVMSAAFLGWYCVGQRSS